MVNNKKQDEPADQDTTDIAELKRQSAAAVKRGDGVEAERIDRLIVNAQKALDEEKEAADQKTKKK